MKTLFFRYQTYPKPGRKYRELNGQIPNGKWTKSSQHSTLGPPIVLAPKLFKSHKNVIKVIFKGKGFADCPPEGWFCKKLGISDRKVPLICAVTKRSGTNHMPNHIRSWPMHPTQLSSEKISEHRDTNILDTTKI
jgi:hypothetical protein